jgi:hypothetical protein
MLDFFMKDVSSRWHSSSAIPQERVTLVSACKLFFIIIVSGGIADSGFSFDDVKSFESS